jgi:HJR/Mrr/RecB family endonuclease
MAKKINKSALVRELFQQNPKIKVKQIIETLGQRKVAVKPSLVYFVKSNMRRKKRKEIRRAMAKAGVPNPVDLILKVRHLASESGGIGKLKQLVDALAE